jgi:hypothetical protein
MLQMQGRLLCLVLLAFLVSVLIYLCYLKYGVRATPRSKEIVPHGLRALVGEYTALEPPLRQGFVAFNPNMILYDGSLNTVMRCWNGKHSYALLLQSLDDSATVLDLGHSQRKFSDALFTGYEDLRLFVYQNRRWATAVNLDTFSATYKAIVVLIDIETYLTKGTENIIPLSYSALDQDVWQKNWSPIVVNNELLMIVHFDPILVVRPNMITGECALHHQAEAKQHPEHDLLRNSTICINVGNDLQLLLVHHQQRLEIATYHLHYHHYFAVIDTRAWTTRLSRPFNVHCDGQPHIEYVSGLLLDYDSLTIQLCWGSEDREARVSRVSFDNVNALFDDKNRVLQ